MATEESYDEAPATALGERTTVERPNRLSQDATLQRAPKVPETELTRREALLWTARLVGGASLAAALPALYPSVAAAPGT